MGTVLKFENVNKYYSNNVHALHSISLEIDEGELVSVIGPSGSGKSTLLRTINRLIDVSDGAILLDGEDITNIGGKKLRAVRRKVGMIFQNYNLVYRLSVLQNVLHGYLGYLDGIKGILGIYPEEQKLRAILRMIDGFRIDKGAVTPQLLKAAHVVQKARQPGQIRFLLRQPKRPGNGLAKPRHPPGMFDLQAHLFILRIVARRILFKSLRGLLSVNFHVHLREPPVSAGLSVS